MRFIAGGPDIPDDLIAARDSGDVIFFCGAGVSQHVAKLPGFEALGRAVVNSLGATSESPARRLLEKALETGRMAGVGGLLATDRVFSLLEREFETSDVRAAVAEAVRPKPGYALDAHRTLLALATSRGGATRLVTTNFDLLFEECEPSLRGFGPPYLPDPRSDREFRGIVHLHGRVNAGYDGPDDDEFVVSSADFGRAYISDGWATRFMRELLARFQVVFVGYTADDPPVQYLLEALNLHAGDRAKLYAFQSGDRSEAQALWEHRGVQAIPFDSADNFAQLWGTLEEWAERSRNVDEWHQMRLAAAKSGPAGLTPFERGQIAHMLSTPQGAQTVAKAADCLDGIWLLSLDPRQRYAKPIRLFDAHNTRVDPFLALGLDDDLPPKPMGDDDFAQREVPAIAFDALSVGQLDRSRSDSATVAGLYGTRSELSAALPPRLVSLSVWLAKVAHQPAVLWWASHQPGLHPQARTLIERALQYEPERFDDAVRRGWRWLFASWDDRRKEADETSFRLRDRLKHEAWSESIVREIIDIRRPRLRVTPGYHHHPLKQNDPADGVVSVDVDYPSAHNPINIHEDYLRYAVEQMTSHLHLSISLEGEILGREWLYLPSSGEGGTKDTETSHGLTGPIVTMRNLLIRLAAKDSKAAEEQVGRWPTDDEYVFARLRLWAAANSITSANTSAELFAKLSDEAFWGSRHRGELLDAIRRRWQELSSDDRSRLEHRLRTGSYPWNDEDTETQAERTAFERLNYLHWLSQNGVDFSFNLDAEIDSLKAIAPQWHERFGKKAAEGSVSGVFSIGTDTDPGQLLRTPLSSILATAQESDRIDFEARVQREPFKGLSNKRPVLALAALTHAGRQGEAPRWAWSHFLQAERRAEDPLRMISAIAGRLDRLSDERLREIAYPVSDWMHRIEARLYGDASLLLPKLWRVVVRALRKEQTHIADRPDRSWADSALNAPVGRLFDLLHDDPSVHNREAAAGLPVDWQNRVEELFTLPGEQRCHAVVLASHNLAWFDRVAPAWTEQNLLPLASDSAVGDAFWDGIIWSGGNGLNERLLRALLPDLKRLARHPRGRRRDDAIVPGLILSSWGQSIGCSTSDQLVTDVELRDLLVLADQSFAHEVIRYLENWSRQDGPWGDRTIYFFECVWPKQRKLRTSATSARLTHLLFESGSLLPRLAPLIVPRPVPLRGGWVNYISRDESDSDPAKQYPAFVLDVMWVILADDPQDWPHGALQTLDVLETTPETASDTRLAELRRRQGI
jgi:hypothetical protein